MKVVDFTRKQQFKMGDEKISNWRCAHSKSTIDELRRLIVCDNCGQHFEPFDYILKIAEKDIRLRNDIKYLSEQGKQLHEEIQELKRERRNIKSQINRANKRSKQSDN
jgi:hypothetical protein